MKYIFLFLIATLTIIFVACEKKKTPLHCYTCVKYDSVHSNIASLTSISSTPENAQDTLCHYSDEEINYYMSTHNTLDTEYNKHDTLITLFSSIQCQEY